MRMAGRVKPYTERGITRCQCQRCGKQATAQWAAPCAINNRYVPLCTECDIALNRMAMHFMRVPHAAHWARLYAKRERTA